MSDDKSLEFHAYSNETLEDCEVKSSNDKIIGGSKPTIVTTHMCKLFCRGSDCKYCKPELKFSGDDMVVEGLYSSWVTSNILAMARPSMNNIGLFSVIDTFNRLGVKTVINMQKPGEHNFCGHPLNDSGFSYDPYVFMQGGIDYFNFPCEDYGVLRVEYLLDITKIMQHQLVRGKVAVHCHAGLGRTGLVIACYLVFNNRVSGIEAINYVRSKRRNSIQNSIQVDKIIEFAAYLEPFRCVIWTPTCKLYRFSLQEAVLRQKKLVHGTEAYILHSIPKVLYLCLWKISKIAQGEERSDGDLFAIPDTSSCENSVSEESAAITTKDFKINQNILQSFLRWSKRMKRCFSTSISEDSANKILYCFTNAYSGREDLEGIKNDLNMTNETWKRLEQVEDLHLHCQLVGDYLDSLKFPVLRTPDIKMLDVAYGDDPSNLLLRLETCVGRTLAMFLGFIDQCRCLGPSGLWKLRSVMLSRLSHKNVSFNMADVHFGADRRYQFDLKADLLENLRSFLNLA